MCDQPFYIIDFSKGWGLSSDRPRQPPRPPVHSTGSEIYLNEAYIHSFFYSQCTVSESSSSRSGHFDLLLFEMEINVGLSVPIALLAIVLARSIPFLYHQATFIIRQRHSTHEPIQSLYHDEDGTATKESQARYSVKVQKYLILFGCILGTAVAITDAVQVTSSKTVPTLAASSWLLSLSWVSFYSGNSVFFFFLNCI